ncbi:MAG: redoxin domain-containing protein, partial [Candidatus Saccharimonadales bacterium]
MKAKLAQGQTAPNFNTLDVLGGTVDLAKLTSRFVLVVFLRYSGCPWCNLAIHRLSLEHPLLRKENCEIIAFIQSSPANIKHNIYDRHITRPPFPIIADYERKIYGRYGVSTSIKSVVKSITDIPFWVHAVKDHGFSQSKIDGKLVMVPAHFLISVRSGKIVMADYNSSFYNHEAFTAIYNAMREARV